MITAEYVAPERVVVESSPERMVVGMPEVRTAISEMERRRGELFCNFGFLAIDIGVIPASGPVMKFEETQLGNDRRSGYVIIKHDGAVRYGLGNSGRFGGVPIDSDPAVELTDDIRECIGATNHHGIAARPVPNGPTAVEVSGDPKKSAKYDITRDTLAIGTRAVGAFALGKAMKELATEPRNFDLSLGLLIAAHLEKTGADWRPREGRDGRRVNEIIEGLREKYIDEVLTPAVLRELDLTGGWRPHVNSLGNRLPLFHLSYSEARTLLAGKLNDKIAKDKDVREKYESRRRAHGNFGSFDKHLSVELDNFLVNRLGLTDPEDKA